MVKSVSVVVRKSEKKDTLYSCLEFDLGYRKLKIFADKYTYQSLLDYTPSQFNDIALDVPVNVNVEKISLIKRHSAKKDVDYVSLSLSANGREITLFTDRFDYCEIFDITPKQFFNLEIGKPYTINIGE